MADQSLALAIALLNDKRLLLKAGTEVHATLIAAHSSTKNPSGTRDPQMHQSKNGNKWFFGMKTPIGADTDSGRARLVCGTLGNVSDVDEANSLHGQELAVFADAGYQSAAKRRDARADGT